MLVCARIKLDLCFWTRWHKDQPSHGWIWHDDCLWASCAEMLFASEVGIPQTKSQKQTMGLFSDSQMVSWNPQKYALGKNNFYSLQFQKVINRTLQERVYVPKVNRKARMPLFCKDGRVIISLYWWYPHGQKSRAFRR